MCCICLYLALSSIRQQAMVCTYADLSGTQKQFLWNSNQNTIISIQENQFNSDSVKCDKGIKFISRNWISKCRLQEVGHVFSVATIWAKRCEVPKLPVHSRALFLHLGNYHWPQSISFPHLQRQPLSGAALIGGKFVELLKENHNCPKFSSVVGVPLLGPPFTDQDWLRD